MPSARVGCCCWSGFKLVSAGRTRRRDVLLLGPPNVPRASAIAELEARREADAAREHHERELEDEMRWAGDDRGEAEAARDDDAVLGR